MKQCRLRIGNDCLNDAIYFNNLESAKHHFYKSARELDRFGQKHYASIHLVKDEQCMPNEYPDYLLSLSKNGNLKIERT